MFFLVRVNICDCKAQIKQYNVLICPLRLELVELRCLIVFQSHETSFAGLLRSLVVSCCMMTLALLNLACSASIWKFLTSFHALDN